MYEKLYNLILIGSVAGIQLMSLITSYCHRLTRKATEIVFAMLWPAGYNWSVSIEKSSNIELSAG